MIAMQNGTNDHAALRHFFSKKDKSDPANSWIVIMAGSIGENPAVICVICVLLYGSLPGKDGAPGDRSYIRYRTVHRSGKRGLNNDLFKNSTPADPPVPSFAPIVRSTSFTWR